MNCFRLCDDRRLLPQGNRGGKNRRPFDPARNEPRGLYDLWHLTGNGLVSPDDLTHAVASKAEFRNRTMTDAKDIFLQKKARLKKLSSVRLSAQIAELPEFDEVYRAVTRELRQVGLLNQT
jgi:hypothetical protein